MDRLQAMAIFLAVVDEGGFAAAARRMRISAPAVTRAIGELENAIGVRLLQRSTRTVRVTEVGSQYAGDCRRILADVAEAENGAAGSHGIPRGKLTITASVLFGQTYITPIVVEYLRRYPDADVECRFLDRVVNVMDEGIDVAIRIGTLPDSSYQALPVGRVRQVVCAAPQYLSARGIPLAPPDLQQHSVISADGITPTLDWTFANSGKPQMVRVRPRMSTTSNTAAIEAAVAGLGLTRVMSYMVSRQLAEGALKTVLAAYESAPVPINIVHQEGRRSTAKVRAFIELAAASLRAHGALN
jgi:DNA-binding transcriptional LysR family regulator